tara:strand:+ start:504 stop:749 length:246 start_codon:yes stop_codon:yes gene_type:complete
MAVTIDERPHVIGDLLMVTGTCASGDTTVDLSSFFSQIVMAQVQATEGTATAVTVAIDADGTGLTWTNLARDGRFTAIGLR